jgi:hypothetical protein
VVVVDYLNALFLQLSLEATLRVRINSSASVDKAPEIQMKSLLGKSLELCCHSCSVGVVLLELCVVRSYDRGRGEQAGYLTMFMLPFVLVLKLNPERLSK